MDNEIRDGSSCLKRSEISFGCEFFRARNACTRVRALEQTCPSFIENGPSVENFEKHSRWRARGWFSNASPRVGREKESNCRDPRRAHTHTHAHTQTHTRGGGGEGNEVAGSLLEVWKIQRRDITYEIMSGDAAVNGGISTLHGAERGWGRWRENIGFHKRTHPAGLFRRVSRKFSKFRGQIPCADGDIVQTRSIVSVDSCRVSPVACVYGETPCEAGGVGCTAG